MVARPIVSLTPWARRYGGSSTLLIAFANENAAEDQPYLRRCMWALFQQGALPAACLLVGAVAVDLNSLGLKDELSIYETAIN